MQIPAAVDRHGNDTQINAGRKPPIQPDFFFTINSARFRTAEIEIVIANGFLQLPRVKVRQEDP
jgi:hypothetical protein